jgi:hypothetical protein
LYSSALQGAQLESGDIICFQKAVPDLPPGHPAAAAADSSGLIKAAPDGMELDEGSAEQQQQQQAAQQAVQQQQDLQKQVQQQQLAAAAVQDHPHSELLKCRYPRVPEFLSYIRNRRLVSVCCHVVHLPSILYCVCSLWWLYKNLLVG